MPNEDININIEVMKEFRKKRSKKNNKIKTDINTYGRSLGPPDISNRNAIIKVFKSTEAYEAFRNKYLYSNLSYNSDTEDRTLEIMRNRCKNKKKRQENMYRQAIKNKDNLNHNEKLYNTIFRDQDFYNDSLKEKSDCDENEKLLSDIYDDTKSINNLELDDTIDISNTENISLNSFIINKPIMEENEEERKEQEQLEIIKYQDNDIKNVDDGYNDSNEKIKIAENIDSHMIEKNSSYKSFSFNDSLKSSEINRSSFGSRNSILPPPPIKASPQSTTLIPLCMDDIINSGSVKLPVIEPQCRRNWHALSINEVYEQRPLWDSNVSELKTKRIIPGIEKKYQRFIPSKNGNNFWKICDGNIYDSLY
ncbi:hypothetical protein BCR36DRAFT_344643 [Piromyces finnis]|uniref:Uncharacterized protein n=1 Tax=Piromyces finnis TaxID=1754191 RepID=A0A1Y1VL77_9FUNG|nr:hypothetical protein BCR36DRAFT_344643 [Piromyces finnis]|eukprot:ORX57866.1 hypothetical protein BCR36DRAFT_344643 [Piromyces finnis]